MVFLGKKNYADSISTAGSFSKVKVQHKEE
jgi:hypothetical protein